MTDLRLEYRDPATLADNGKNWRKHPKLQMDALEGVIAEVGWAGALLYNEQTGRLIDGHARKKLPTKGEMVPVLIGSWTEEQEAKILLTFDPIGAMADQDGAALAALLETVRTDNASVQTLLDSLKPASDDGTNDLDALYDGMPEYVSDDQESEYKIIVHFDNFEDVQDFGSRMGQSVTKQTRYIWHPYKPPVKLQDFTVTDGDDES